MIVQCILQALVRILSWNFTHRGLVSLANVRLCPHCHCRNDHHSHKNVHNVHEHCHRRCSSLDRDGSDVPKPSQSPFYFSSQGLGALTSAFRATRPLSCREKAWQSVSRSSVNGKRQPTNTRGRSAPNLSRVFHELQRSPPDTTAMLWQFTRKRLMPPVRDCFCLSDHIYLTFPNSDTPASQHSYTRLGWRDRDFHDHAVESPCCAQADIQK